MVWTVPPLPIAALAHTFGQSVAENHHHTHRGCCCCCCWRRRRPACLTCELGSASGTRGQAGSVGNKQDVMLTSQSCFPFPSPASPPRPPSSCSGQAAPAHRGALPADGSDPCRLNGGAVGRVWLARSVLQMGCRRPDPPLLYKSGRVL